MYESCIFAAYSVQIKAEAEPPTASWLSDWAKWLPLRAKREELRSSTMGEEGTIVYGAVGIRADIYSSQSTAVIFHSSVKHHNSSASILIQ